MHAPPLLVLLGWSAHIIEYPSMDNALSSFETEESRWVSDIHRISNLWTKLKACNWETFKELWVVKLFRFQWQIKKYFGPGLSSMSPCCNSVSAK